MTTSQSGRVTKTQLLTVFVIISVFLVFLTSFVKYVFAKDYLFYIESSCDVTTQVCYVRDCEDYCPPNGISIYSAFYIKASEFPLCTTNSCANICTNESTAYKCESIECDSTNGDACSDESL